MVSRPDNALLWSQAGGSIRAEVYGRWWAAVPKSKRFRSPAFVENQKLLEKKWHTTWGDRLNEVVIIGQNLDKEKITSELTTCLCNQDEINHHLGGGAFTDNWPLDEN